MTKKQNLPPEFDSPKDPESNVIRGSGEKFNNEFSDEISGLIKCFFLMIDIN